MAASRNRQTNKFESKADMAFKSKLKVELRSRPLDGAIVEKLFNQYGTYLELIGGEASVEETRVFTWPRQVAR